MVPPRAGRPDPPGRRWFLVAALLVSSPAAQDDTPLRVTHGPIVLHADLFLHWGGHTFGYLIEGERSVYWTGRRAEAGPAVVGRFPRPGTARPPSIGELPAPAEATAVTVHPQLLRTPDGHLHVFVGQVDDRGGGTVRYLRSARPGAVDAWLDRTECLPVGRYPHWAAKRKNVGISRDGQRAVLVTLTAFQQGSSLQNWPLIAFGQRDGDDFQFGEPRRWADEQLPFFYPQVAVTDHGPVLVGAVDADPSRHAELVHLDDEGAVLFRQRLPHPQGTAQTWAYDLQPLDPDDWSRLVLVRSIRPADRPETALELWLYDARARTLVRQRRVDFAAAHAARANAGHFLVARDRAPVFINEPNSRQLAAWQGDLIGDGPCAPVSLPRTQVADFGYRTIRSVFVPSVLHGSIPHAGSRAVAADVAYAAGEPTRVAWLLWRVALR
ncbi:MAG: hypothetical protein AAF628_34305 [Planctomycetota bacterium]